MSARTFPSLLSQLAVSTLAYAAAVALVGLYVVPTILTPLPLSVLAPEPPTVVARAPAPASTPQEIAP